MGALLTLVLALILGYALSKPTRLDPHEKPKSQFGLQLAWPSDGPVRANGTEYVQFHIFYELILTRAVLFLYTA